MPPSTERKREGACPPLRSSTGAQVGPWVARGHRPPPAAPKTGGGSGHPKEKRERRMSLDFGGGVDRGGGEFGNLVVDLKWRWRNWR